MKIHVTKCAIVAIVTFVAAFFAWAMLHYAIAASSPTARVYLMRGLAGQVYSRGMDTVAVRAEKEAGVAAVRYLRSWARASSLYETIKANAKRDHLPIVIGGHSLGADYSVKVANWLLADGIQVELLLLIDPTPNIDPIPANVHRAVNLRQEHFGFGRGSAYPGPGFSGTLVNKTFPDPSHVQIDDWRPAQDIQICEIQRATLRTDEPSKCVTDD